MQSPLHEVIATLHASLVQKFEPAIIALESFGFRGARIS